MKRGKLFGKRSEYASSYWLEHSFLFIEVCKYCLELLVISLAVRFIFLLQIIPESIDVGWFLFWVMFYPWRVSIAPVVSLGINVLRLFVDLLGSNFLTGVLVVVFMLGGIILVLFWVFMFGVGPFAAPFCIESLGQLEADILNVLQFCWQGYDLLFFLWFIQILVFFAKILYLFGARVINLYLPM